MQPRHKKDKNMEFEGWLREKIETIATGMARIEERLLHTEGRANEHCARINNLDNRNNNTENRITVVETQTRIWKFIAILAVTLHPVIYVLGKYIINRPLP